MPVTPPPYYDPNCEAFALQQALVIPTTPELVYVLNPDDITFDNVDADKLVTIKYSSFTRSLSGVLKEFSITLYNVSAEDYQEIANFARTDFLSKVRTTGRGSISLYLRGERYDNLYIQAPIIAPKSVWKNWQAVPTEVFETVQLKIIDPNPTWF